MCVTNNDVLTQAQILEMTLSVNKFCKNLTLFNVDSQNPFLSLNGFCDLFLTTDWCLVVQVNPSASSSVQRYNFLSPSLQDYFSLFSLLL